MKKILTAITIAAAAVSMALAGAAGNTIRHEQNTVSIGTNGAAVWTNAVGYSHFTVTGVYVMTNLNLTNQVTLKRITATQRDTGVAAVAAYTQTMVTAVCVAGYAASNTVQVPTLLYQDQINITSLVATNGTLLLEGDRYDWR